MSRLRIPTLTNPNIVIRMAESQEEVDAANRLVFRNYVELGYWENSEDVIRKNRYLWLPTRDVFVVADGAKIIGTISIITDSADGIPADNFQPAAVRRLRETCDKLAEISAFAFAKDHPHQHTLLHFLMAFIAQYSFHYAGIDRLIAVCTPKHARFYELCYGFKRTEAAGMYDYVKVDAQLLTLDLCEIYETAPPYGDPHSRGEFFDFLYFRRHPNLRFPVPRRRPVPVQIPAGRPAYQLPVAV